MERTIQFLAYLFVICPVNLISLSMLDEEQLREIAPLELFADGEELFERMNALTYSFDLATTQRSEEHADCDLRLVQRIRDILVPMFGVGTNARVRVSNRRATAPHTAQLYR